MRIKSIYLTALIGLVISMGSCTSTKKISYFQDLQDGQENIIPALNAIKMQPYDKLSIVVSTTDSRLNALFNLPVATNRLGSTSADGSVKGSTSGGDGNVMPYTIDSKGNINFPVLGKLYVAGMTREEMAEYIKRELISRDLAKNPIVTVEFINMSVAVIGEVSSPGRYAITRDNYTLLDALSSAGDLTIYGKLDNIRVLREENGVQKTYMVNLNSGSALTNSPVYYLRQNDVVYVEPNATKARQSTPNGNSVMTPAFWISIASFIATMAVLIIK